MCKPCKNHRLDLSCSLPAAHSFLTDPRTRGLLRICRVGVAVTFSVNLFRFYFLYSHHCPFIYPSISISISLYISSSFNSSSPSSLSPSNLPIPDLSYPRFAHNLSLSLSSLLARGTYRQNFHVSSRASLASRVVAVRVRCVVCSVSLSLFLKVFCACCICRTRFSEARTIVPRFHARCDIGFARCD